MHSLSTTAHEIKIDLGLRTRDKESIQPVTGLSPSVGIFFPISTQCAPLFCLCVSSPQAYSSFQYFRLLRRGRGVPSRGVT